MTEIKVSMSEVLGKGYNKFFHSRNFYRVVKGSRGSKKSKSTALAYVHDILKYPWANLLVIRRFSNTNKQSTYMDFKWATQRLQVADKFKFNESLPEITVKETGQKILFRGLDDELKITSITVDVGILCWAWFEEAYQIETQSKFETIVESIRGYYAAPDFYKQITVTFNPWSEHHWLKATFFDKETKKYDVFADTTTFRDNEWLDEQDKARYLDLYKTNPIRARVVCDGNWGITEGLVFENYKVAEFDSLKKIKEIELTCHGMDYGFKQDPTTFISAILDLEKKKIYLYEELYKLHMTTDEIYQAVLNMGYQNEEIVGDNSEPRLLAELKAKGLYRIVPCRKGKDSILHGINFLQSFEIIIHPSCEKSIEEFSSYSYLQDKNGNWLNKPEDKNNHIIDALRYAVEKYSIPRNKVNQKETYRRIKNLF
ncbi:PBSX family phage terminase large subunit [Melissococcus plutonius]|uniref:PBSX family phage terminase large subunit n=1 Tax=Melissococcus plutonius TaxID=33970 RepID=UPI0021E5C9A6|nr:PBSX family phage terminase large subunit [Melissococcus plutonius]MCV2528034.1 PBSX family phage terminase large subunit [Melissococcus plutonius]